MALVSIIVPCYNEETTIQFLLDALYRQTFPRTQLEIVIADGISTDFTLQRIQEFQNNHPDLLIRVIKNDRRTIPSGVNAAIRNAQGDIIIRLDAHSMPHCDYVTKCVENLTQKYGDNVGGVWEIQPGKSGWLANSIALAASNPLGVGDARYRFTKQAGPVDTVPFGAFRRTLIDKVGLFDESLLTNEDYEFNTRVRRAGGTVWLDPAIRTVYFARSDLAALGRQYWRYGYWKLRMLRRYPNTIRWRQALPPIFVAGLIVLGLLAIFLPIFRWLFLSILGMYLLVLILDGLFLAIKHHDASLIIGIPLSIVVMHFSWGAAFLWSLLGR
jgi:succinoglycan biosynthesis protein ExoA